MELKGHLPSLTVISSSYQSEAHPGCRLLDNFSDCVSFHPCDHSKGSTIKAHFQALDHLHYKASTNPSTLVVVADARFTWGRPTLLWLYIPLEISLLVTWTTLLISGTALVRPNGLFTSWCMKILPTFGLLLVNIHPLPSMLFALRVLLHVWTPREPSSAISHIKVATFFLSKVVAGFYLLVSQLHCVPEWLEPFSTILLLGSSDSAFSLQSALSVHVAIVRWKHVDTSLLTVIGLLMLPWLIYCHWSRTLSSSWRSTPVHSVSFDSVF